MTRPRRLGVGAALVDGELVPGDVALDRGVVSAVGLPPARGGGLAVPGLVDLQVNGYHGVDFLTSGEADWATAARALAADGVTAYVANFLTAAPTTTADGLRTARRVADSEMAPGHARCLGAHLEGPFLAAGRRGTHPLEHLQEPSRSLLEQLLAEGPVVGVTLAPELPGALGLVSRLVEDGRLVALGHSDATAEQAHVAFDAGARTVTHLFNAMSGLSSRAPGLAGAALARSDVTVQLILDGVHLSPESAQVALRVAPERVVLVTDAISAAGAPDGTYSVGDSVVVTKKGGAARNADGGLAGGIDKLATCLRHAVELGLRVEEAVAAATTRPARLVGRSDLGSLRPGDRADVVVLDDAFDVAATWVSGVPAA